MDEIASLVNDKQYSEVVGKCVVLEVEMASRNAVNGEHHNSAFFGVYLASMLVIGDYLGVTQLCERLEVYGALLSADASADPMSKNPELFTLRLLGQRLGQGDNSAAYQILKASSSPFSPTTLPIIADVKDSLLTSSKRAIVAAYTRISLETMCQMLNTDPEKALQFVEEWGWIYDASSKLVEPKPDEADKSYDAKASAEQVNNIAKYISHFEQKNISVKLNSKSGRFGSGKFHMGSMGSMGGDVLSEGIASRDL